MMNYPQNDKQHIKLNNDDNIFTYRIKNKYHKIQSKDVNDYLKKFGDFSAKNFRTWGANIEFIYQVVKACQKEFPKNNNEIKKTLNDCIKVVAHKLHNTTSVCKSNYLDPELINLLEVNLRGGNLLEGHPLAGNTFQKVIPQKDIYQKVIF